MGTLRANVLRALFNLCIYVKIVLYLFQMLCAITFIFAIFYRPQLVYTQLILTLFAFSIYPQICYNKEGRLHTFRRACSFANIIEH